MFDDLAGIFDSLFEPLSAAFFWLLELLHTNLGISWSWSIVVLTVIVRIILIPLTWRQVKSMRAMQALAPHIKELQQKYKDDRQLLNQKTMEFYREHKVSPFGSCLPLLLQLPVFLGLFYMLRAAGAEPTPDGPAFAGAFLNPPVGWLWLSDITQFSLILMFLYIVSQFLASYQMARKSVGQQKMIAYFMPIVIGIFMYVGRWPAGLMIYWFTSNLWTIAQQYVAEKIMPVPIPTLAALDGGGKGADAGTGKPAAAKARQGKPAASKQGGGKPGGKQQGAKPSGKPGGKQQGAKPSGKPGGKQQGVKQPGAQPSGKPSGKPGSQTVPAKQASGEQTVMKPGGSTQPGAKPAGTKPAGARPAGSKPGGPGQAAAKPPGPRPGGPGQAGAKPAGPRPGEPTQPGAKPAGTKPAGARPAGADAQGKTGPPKQTAANSGGARATGAKDAGARPAEMSPAGGTSPSAGTPVDRTTGRPAADGDAPAKPIPAEASPADNGAGQSGGKSSVEQTGRQGKPTAGQSQRPDGGAGGSEGSS